MGTCMCLWSHAVLLICLLPAKLVRFVVAHCNTVACPQIRPGEETLVCEGLLCQPPCLGRLPVPATRKKPLSGVSA